MTYLNLKGSINTARAMRARLDTSEQFEALWLAGQAMGITAASTAEVRDEMTKRLEVAWLEILTFDDEQDFIDWKDTQECARC